MHWLSLQLQQLPLSIVRVAALDGSRVHIAVVLQPQIYILLFPTISGERNNACIGVRPDPSLFVKGVAPQDIFVKKTTVL